MGPLVHARTRDYRGRVGPGRGCRGTDARDGPGRRRRPPGRDLRDRCRAVHRAAGLLRPGQDRLPDPPGARVVRRGVRGRRRGRSGMAGRPGDRGHHARLRALPAVRGRARARLRQPPRGRHRGLAGRAGGAGPGPRVQPVPAARRHRRPVRRPGRTGRQRLAGRLGRSGRSCEADPGLRAGHHRAADHGVRHGDGGRGGHLGAGARPGGTGRGLRRLRLLDGRRPAAGELRRGRRLHRRPPDARGRPGPVPSRLGGWSTSASRACRARSTAATWSSAT